MLWLVSSFVGVTVIGLSVLPPLFTVTASRAASLTAFLETLTSYSAPASPEFLPLPTVISAILVSPVVAAFLTTLSVEAAVAGPVTASTATL